MLFLLLLLAITFSPLCPALAEYVEDGGIKLSGCSPDASPARVIFACTGSTSQKDEHDKQSCSERNVFQAIFKCSLDPIPGRKTVKDVFKFAETFKVEEMTDSLSISI